MACPNRALQDREKIISTGDSPESATTARRAAILTRAPRMRPLLHTGFTNTLPIIRRIYP
jgi:hypothetical protein